MIAFAIIIENFKPNPKRKNMHIIIKPFAFIREYFTLSEYQITLFINSSSVLLIFLELAH